MTTATAIKQSKTRASWDALGLSIIAALVDRLVRKTMSQNALAMMTGTSGCALRNLRKNGRGVIVCSPDADTLHRIAPKLVNPLTKRVFAQDEIIQLALGVTAQKTFKALGSKVKTKSFDNDGYWDEEGLALIGRMLDDLVVNNFSQNALAEDVQLSPSTLRNLRSNQDGVLLSTPDPDTLRKIAPYLTNPYTKRQFTTGEIISFATTVHHAKTLREFVETYLQRRGETLRDLAEACDSSVEEVSEVLDSPQSLPVERRIPWLLMLSKEFNDILQVSRFMGIPTNVCRG